MVERSASAGKTVKDMGLLFAEDSRHREDRPRLYIFLELFEPSPFYGIAHRDPLNYNVLSCTVRSADGG